MRWTVAVLLLSLVLAGCEEDNPTEVASNLPPTIVAIPDTSIAVGDTLRIRAHATDPESDELVYQLIVSLTVDEVRRGYQAQAGMDGASGEFWFAPAPADRPQRVITVTVMDTHAGRDATTFTVEVP